MRVLVICAAGIVSGKEIMSLHLLRELKERNHDCYCVASNWGSKDFRERLRVMGIPFFLLRIGFISKTLNWSSIRMTLIQFIYMPILFLKYQGIRKNIRPDIIIHTNFHHLFLLYPILAKKKNIYWSHEVIGNTSFYKWLFRLFSKKVETFVAVSGAVAKSLDNLIGEEKIKIIKNGTTLPEPANKREDHGKFMLAIIGQVSSVKGHEVLFQALANIPRDKFRLRIVGDGNINFISRLKMLAEELGIQHNCVWSGYLSNPSEIYNAVDGVIVPSTFPDPYPTTVMEAGLRGIPVIASSIGGLPEMINEGINGFLCTAGDVNELTAAIVKLIDFPDPDGLRRQSLDFALRNFDVKIFANNFEELILRLNK